MSYYTTLSPNSWFNSYYLLQNVNIFIAIEYSFL